MADFFFKLVFFQPCTSKEPNVRIQQIRERWISALFEQIHNMSNDSIVMIKGGIKLRLASENSDSDFNSSHTHFSCCLAG